MKSAFYIGGQKVGEVHHVEIKTEYPDRHMYGLDTAKGAERTVIQCFGKSGGIAYREWVGNMLDDGVMVCDFRDGRTVYVLFDSSRVESKKDRRGRHWFSMPGGRVVGEVWA